MANVFIAYATRDRAFAERLARALERQGEHVWLDTREIQPGQSVPDAIRAALSEADHMVVVLSNAALDTSHVPFELGAAEALGKHILAVTPSDMALPDPLPLPLHERQILHGAGMSTDRIAATLRERLVA